MPLIRLKDDPDESVALYRYDFGDGDFRFSSEVPSAILEGMTFGWNKSRINFIVLGTSEGLESDEDVSLPEPFNLPLPSEVEIKAAKGKKGLHKGFKNSERIDSIHKDLYQYFLNLDPKKLRIRFQIPAALESETKEIFEAHNLLLPEWWRPVNSGSRGGTCFQYGALGEVWFPAPADVSILPEGFQIIDGEARCSVLSFVISLLLSGFLITDGPHKKEEHAI